MQRCGQAVSAEDADLRIRRHEEKAFLWSKKVRDTNHAAKGGEFFTPPHPDMLETVNDFPGRGTLKRAAPPPCRGFPLENVPRKPPLPQRRCCRYPRQTRP